jgi:hypothetical protein
VEIVPAADHPLMSARRIAIAVACTASLLAPAGAQAAYSVGTHEQIVWVRRAATRFVTAELTRNGAEACAVLNAPMRAVQHGTSCERRWNGKLAAMLRKHGERARLRAQLHQIDSAAVVVHGNVATLELPSPLIAGANHFLWTENCWMLEG